MAGTSEEELEQRLAATDDPRAKIGAKDKRKLFGKFARLSAVPTGGESSTGLGLWIVKQRVTQLGGSIRCISKEGAGARFVVEMPNRVG